MALIKFLCIPLATAFVVAGCVGHDHAHHAQAASPSGHSHEHRFSDAERWAKVFDDPSRDAWQKPAEVITALKLAPNAMVADIGAGTGYFAARLARAVPQGRVFAVDTERDMVRYLGERAAKEGLANLSPVLAKPGDAALPQPVDCILLVDVYHHIDDRVGYFNALRRSLSSSGRIAIVDFTMETTRGPGKMSRIAADQVRAELDRAGFALAEEHRFLPDQYFLVFRPR